MILISAVAKKNMAIGKGNSLPWHIPEEYKHFKEKVKGFPVIMGRKTYQLLFKGEGQDYEEIPDSKMIVVTRNPERLRSEDERWKDVDLCTSLEQAMSNARKYNEKFFCAGGLSLYKQALENNLADKMYLSEVEGDYNEGITAYFPEFDKNVWKETRREKHHNGVDWDFVIYEREK